MALPLSFREHVEQHPCFTGCYSSASRVQVCLDPNAPLTSLVVVSCRDCYANVAVPAALLPPGMDSYQLADHLTQHVRKQRGFELSVSGYFTKGPGFWFSAVYYPCGLFLIHGERSRQVGSDLDQLLLAFQHGVLTPPDPRMTDATLYTVQTVFGNFTASSPVAGKQDLLAAPQVRTRPQSGWQKLTLAEFLPLTTTTATASAMTTVVPTVTRTGKALALGDVCPKCGAEVRQRPLLRGSFIGCLC